MEQKARIAVLTKRESYHMTVLDGFLAERSLLGQNNLVDVSVLPLEKLDFKVVSQRVDAVIETNPALVVTIGSLSTQAIAYAFDERKIETPHIFCGVTSVRDVGLEDILDKAGSRMSGISLGYPSYLTVARALLWLKPTTKAVIIPYSTSPIGGLLTTAAYLVREFLVARGIAVKLLALTGKESVVESIRLHFGVSDVLLTLEGCVVDQWYKELVELCEERTATYFSSSLAAVRGGAAFGLVCNPQLVGAVAFRRCLQAITDGHVSVPSGSTLLKNKGRRMAINLAALKRQGVYMDAARLYFISHLEVLGDLYSLIDRED